MVEVRIPTHKRPALLKRALESLRQQTYHEWNAYVLDDSIDREGEAVVNGMNCEQIVYLPNTENLGSARNLNQAFRQDAFGGAEYAFVLEDDNWVYPQFIERSLETLDRKSLDIAMSNQHVWIQEKDECRRDVAAPLGTRGGWMTQGMIEPKSLRAHLFYHEGISNGGLFWRLGVDVNFEVSNRITNTLLQ